MPDVVDLFLACAARQPDHPAIVTSRETVTYGELERRVRTLAARFAARPAPKVFIALPLSVDVYASILAAGLAGGFHTPVNLGSPTEKMRRIIKQLEPDVLVAQGGLLDELSAAAPHADRIDPADVGEENVFQGTGERHKLAYVFFTSGSTGDPKGVMISRTALAHYVRWLETFCICPEDRISQQPNIAFDISMTDIFGALCYGATLYPLDAEGDRLMPARFIQRHGITIWNSTPSVVSLMMQARQVRQPLLSSVRLFNFCGEPLLKEHLDAIFAALPEVVVQNTYGPTEATISVTALTISARNYLQHCRSSVALGNTIPGMEIVLCGGPDGNDGEIVIVGPQLAEGYWNDPAKTAAQFRPVSGDDPRRGYFTGDRAERLDGDLYFRERMDFQVKVRGHRIELDEVSAAIRACGYPVACVFKHKDGLAAVVESPAAGAAFDAQALKARLASLLDSYAIPEQIVMVERVPRNDNDKLDSKAAAALLDAGQTGAS